jgi:hypothetical protein
MTGEGRSLDSPAVLQPLQTVLISQSHTLCARACAMSCASPHTSSTLGSTEIVVRAYENTELRESAGPRRMRRAIKTRARKLTVGG